MKHCAFELQQQAKLIHVSCFSEGYFQALELIICSGYKGGDPINALILVTISQKAHLVT